MKTLLLSAFLWGSLLYLLNTLLVSISAGVWDLVSDWPLSAGMQRIWLRYFGFVSFVPSGMNKRRVWLGGLGSPWTVMFLLSNLPPPVDWTWHSKPKPCVCICWVAMVKLLCLIHILLCVCSQPSLMQFTQSLLHTLGCLHKSQYKQTVSKQNIWKSTGQTAIKLVAICGYSWFPVGESFTFLTTHELFSPPSVRTKRPT